MSTIIDSVNAFTQFIENSPRDCSGPLSSYRFAVKDVFEIKGLRVQAGNPEFYNQANVATETAPAVSLLENAGAELVGKTHTDELGGSLFGLNAHYGTPVNSNTPERVPGGSSSGSAAAVAGSLVDFSLGGDTSGSVRAPASFCGIYGFRPTLGHISAEGVLPISNHLDTVGIFAKSPKLIGEVLNVYGFRQSQTLNRLRVVPALVDRLDSILAQRFRSKIDLIRPLLNTQLELQIPEESFAHWSKIIRIIAMYDLWQVHKQWILDSTPTFGHIIEERIKAARSLQLADYNWALKQQKEMKQFMEQNIKPGDVVVFPTVHDIPPVLSSTFVQLKEFSLKASYHTCSAALSGFPEISVPLKDMKQKCSLGMSMLATPGSDQSLIQLAAQAQPLFDTT